MLMFDDAEWPVEECADGCWERTPYIEEDTHRADLSYKAVCLSCVQEMRLAPIQINLLSNCKTAITQQVSLVLYRLGRPRSIS